MVDRPDRDACGRYRITDHLTGQVITGCAAKRCPRRITESISTTTAPDNQTWDRMRNCPGPRKNQNPTS